MNRDAAVWLASHLEGPDHEAAEFVCFWCDGDATTHKKDCPFYAASHQLTEEAQERSTTGK